MPRALLFDTSDFTHGNAITPLMLDRFANLINQYFYITKVHVGQKQLMPH